MAYVRKADRVIVDMLRDLKYVAIPQKDINEWLHELTRETNYILGESCDGGIRMTCTYCGESHMLMKRPKLRQKCTCPHCGNTYEYHRAQYSHTCESLPVYYTVLQKVGCNIFSRYFVGQKYIPNGQKAYRYVASEKKRKLLGSDITLRYSQFTTAPDGFLVETNYITRCGYFGYYSYFEEESSWVYAGNVKAMFENTEYRYSAIEYIAGSNVEFRPFEYLRDSLTEPTKERLAKMGLLRLAVQYQGSTKEDRMLGKLRSDRKLFLLAKESQIGFSGFETVNVCECETVEEVLCALKNRWIYHYADVRKYISKTKAYKYLNDKDIGIYVDYLRCCDEVGRNTKDKKILFPENLRRAHDEVMTKRTEIRSKKLNENIKKRAENLKAFIYKDNRYVIRPVESNVELIEESKKLVHCVRNYASDVAKGKTAIFLVRSNKNPEEPFVTVELKGKKVIQARAKNNGQPPKSARDFIHKWETQFHLSGW